MTTQASIGMTLCKLENNMRFASGLGFLIGRGFRYAEAAFLQDAHRPDVVFRDTGDQWPSLFEAKKGSERFAGNASSPKGAVEPIADLAFPVAEKTGDVSRDLPVGYDGLSQTALIRQDLGPMRVELGPVAGTEYDHRDRDGISLVFKKDGQVARFDIA